MIKSVLFFGYVLAYYQGKLFKSKILAFYQGKLFKSKDDDHKNHSFLMGIPSCECRLKYLLVPQILQSCV